MNLRPLDEANKNHIKEILSNIAILGGFSPEMTDAIISNLKEVTIKKGEYIFHAGDSPKNIYIILEGRVECYFDNKKVHEFSQGLSLAEAAVIGIQKFKSDAIAAEDCELLVLSKMKLLELFENDKEVFSLLILNIARELARRIAAMGDALRNYKDLETKKED